MPTGLASKAAVSSVASSLGTTDANGRGQDVVEGRIGLDEVDLDRVSSMALIPLAVLALPDRTSAAPTMLPKKAPDTGDGAGFRFGSSTRLIE